MGVAPSHDDIPPRPNDPSSSKEEAQLPQNSTKTLKPALKEKTQLPQNSAKTLKPALKEETQLPHKCNEILKLATSPVDRSSMKKLYEQLYAGVYFDHGNKKYWVDRESKSNCFKLFPRGLRITRGDDTRSWQWHLHKELGTAESFEVAEMLKCSWVGIYGRLEMAYLSPGTNYVAVFVVALTDSAYGWEEPLDFKLAFPDGTTKVYTIRLDITVRRQRLSELRTEPFKASGMVGEMEASIQQRKVARRAGLFIKWISFRPESA